MGVATLDADWLQHAQSTASYVDVGQNAMCFYDAPFDLPRSTAFLQHGDPQIMGGILHRGDTTLRWCSTVPTRNS